MKRSHTFMLAAALAVYGATAAESSLVFADAGLATGDIAAQSPISVGEDILLTFEQGSAMAAPSINGSGRVSITMGSSFKVVGRTADVKITNVDLTCRSASYMFSNGAVTCVPEGTFTRGNPSPVCTWELPEGTNSVTFTNTMGSAQLTQIKVAYTGGTGGDGGGEEPDKPGPDPVTPGENAFHTSFDTAEEFGALTVVNVEDGSNTWRYDCNKQVAYILNDMGGVVAKNDYLVTPALRLSAGLRYRVGFTAFCENPAYPERIAAYVGTSPTAEGLSSTVVAPVEIDSRTPAEYYGVFTPEADGTYHAALHAASDAGMFYLYVSDFTVSRGVALSAPAAVADLRVTPSPAGELSAVVSMTAPDTTEGGAPLAGLTSVVVKRGDVEIATLPATPGAVLTCTDVVEAAGNYTYTATAVAPSGKSFDSRATAYIGLAAPADPVALSVTETAVGVLRFEWDAVTKNVYGNDIDPAVVKYTITANGTSDVVAEGLSGTSAELALLAPGQPQEIGYFVIKASTSAGTSEGSASTPSIAYGTPYAMPWSEGFPDAQPSVGNVVEVIPDAAHGSVAWSCFEAMVNDDIIPVTADGGMLGLFSMYAGDRSTWRTGKVRVSEDAVNPYLTFYYFTSPGAADVLEVYVGDKLAFSTSVGGETRGWKRAAVSLNEYKGQDVRVSLVGICADPAVRLAVDDLRIADEPDTDIALTRARVPYEMMRGKTHRCNVRVRNLGIKPVGSYTVSVTLDGVLLASATGSLGADDSASHDFDLACPAGDTAEYEVSVAAEGDEVEENNSTVVATKVADSHLAAPSAPRVVEGGMLAWDAPVQAPREITEGFEAYDEFLADNAGEWGFIDGDASPVLGIRDGYHGYPNMFSPMAFMVFNNHDGFFPRIGTSVFDPYEGGQCMMSASVDVMNSSERDNDDWLISPMLSGDAQRVSFYARSSGMVFPENFKVMASSTDRLASSFSEVLNVERASSEWTRYEAGLPAGTRYFAIRNVSHDQYMFFVDNVSFIAAPSTEVPIGYDILASDTSDGPWEQLNEAPVTDTCFSAASLADGVWVKVRANYASGVSADSSPGLIQVSGIEESGFDAPAVKTYYDTRGIRVDGKPSAPGVYIERSGAAARRVVVR